MNFRITRREFLKYCSIAAGTVGLSSGTIMKLEKALALEAANGGTPTVWLAGAACTGCTMSLTNSIYYMKVADLLLGVLDLDFHDTIMGAAGNEACGAAQTTLAAGGFVLVVEGAVQTATVGGVQGIYNTIGDVVGDGNETMLHAVREYAKKAALIICVGQCATFGGIPAAKGSVTGAMGVYDALNPVNGLANGLTAPQWKAVRKKIINIPGCPPHPDWIVGTIAGFLADHKMPAIDSLRRPKDFFSTVHCLNGCPRYGTQDTNGYAYAFDGAAGVKTDKCLKQIGCKGRQTKTDCPVRYWNAHNAGDKGINYCVAASYPCHGCTQKGFPDNFSPFIKLS